MVRMQSHRFPIRDPNTNPQTCLRTLARKDGCFKMEEKKWDGKDYAQRAIPMHVVRLKICNNNTCKITLPVDTLKWKPR